MNATTVAAVPSEANTGDRTDQRGSWRRDVLVGLLVVVIVAAGIEGVAFAAWVSGDAPAWLLIGALFGFGVITAVVQLASSLGGGRADGESALAAGLQTICLVAVTGSVFVMLWFAVLVAMFLQATVLESPDSVPSTIASVEGQRELLLNGVNVTLSLILAAAFIGLLLLRRRSP